MAELFGETGMSQDLALSPPNLVGIFLPGVDNPEMSDGLGLKTPWGGGGTVRTYQDYGPSQSTSAGQTQLNDLSSVLIAGAGGGAGLSYNFEGLVGPQGIPGPPGVDGVTQIIYSGAPGMFDISNSLQEIEALGTKIDQMIYTDAVEYTYEWTNKGETSGSATGHDSWVDVNEDMTVMYNAQEAFKVYKSTDYGDNWSDVTPSGKNGSNFSSVSCDNSGDIVVTTIQNSTDHVWVSQNGGSNWTETYPVAPGPTTNYVCSAVSPDGSVILAGDYAKRLWKSTDYGSNWAEIQPAGDTNKGWKAVACSSDGSYIVAVNDTDLTKIYYSSDGGSTWSSGTVTGTTVWKEVACSSSGQYMIAVGQVNVCHISTNYGASWTRIYPYDTSIYVYWNSVDISDGGGTILICGYKYVAPTYYNLAMSSFDHGSTWTTEFYTAATLYFYSCAISGEGSLGVISRPTKLANQPLFVSTSYGVTSWAETTITPFARTLVDDYSAAEAALTLGLGTTDDVTFNDLTLTTPSNIYALSHDSFADFVSNEHIDHTSVTLTAGTGLTGGGDISANRSFAVDGVLEDLDTLGANAADGEFLVGTGAGALAWESGATVRTSIGLGAGDTATLANLIIADGGTIGSASDTDVMTIDASGNTTFSVFPITPSAAPDADYEVANKKYVDDNSGTDNYTVKVDAGATADYIGAASNDGVLRVTTTNGLTYTDGGNFVTIAFDADYTDISGNDAATDVTGAELETLTDGSNTGLHHHFVDRGDPASSDFEVGDLTTDGSWYDLDLGPNGSGIVPSGTVAVLLNLKVTDDAANSYVAFRRNGNSNAYTAPILRTQVANIANDNIVVCPCDSDGVIEYSTTNTTFSVIRITVIGWWL